MSARIFRSLAVWRFRTLGDCPGRQYVLDKVSEGGRAFGPVRLAGKAAGKQILISPKLCLLKPHTDGYPRQLAQLELYRPPGFPLDHQGAREYFGPA